jgi:hypothetical protein
MKTTLYSRYLQIYARVTSEGRITDKDFQAPTVINPLPGEEPELIPLDQQLAISIAAADAKAGSTRTPTDFQTRLDELMEK